MQPQRGASMAADCLGNGHKTRGKTSNDGVIRTTKRAPNKCFYVNMFATAGLYSRL